MTDGFMKRFAVHRLWVWDRSEVCGLSLVEVDEVSHIVSAVRPLACETERTEWIGGFVIVAPQCTSPLSGESFDAYRKRLLSEWDSAEYRSSHSLYAYHFSPFNVVDMDFPAVSRMTVL